jgi:hypothetical protein
VPAFGTPVGIHPVVLHGIDGAYCAPYDRDAWRAALAAPLAAAEPRVAGRRRAELFSSDRMAARVVEAWRALLAERRARNPILGLRGVHSDAPRRP